MHSTDLKKGETYFLVRYYGVSNLVPQIEPLYYLGIDEISSERIGEPMHEFDLASSAYQREVRAQMERKNDPEASNVRVLEPMVIAESGLTEVHSLREVIEILRSLDKE